VPEKENCMPRRSITRDPHELTVPASPVRIARSGMTSLSAHVTACGFIGTAGSAARRRRSSHHWS
jgi:hypothetical protein